MSDGARHLTIVPPPGPEDDVQLTLMDHLRELRKRIVVCAWALMIGFGVCYGFVNPIYRWVMAPINDAMTTCEDSCYTYYFAEPTTHWVEQSVYRELPSCDAVVPACTMNGVITSTNPTMAFFVFMRIAAYASVFLVSPFLLFQFYQFVSPGLYRREKRLLVPFVVLGVIFFVGGGLFGRYVILPFALDVLIKGYTGPTSPNGIASFLSMDDTVDLVLMVLMAFGIIFELPLILTLLARLGVVSSTFLRKYRRHAIVLNTFIAAVVTPTGDAFNLALMAVPLCIFYELGIIGATFMERQRKDGDGIRMPDDPTPAGA